MISLLITGVGGQGVLTLSRIICEAAFRSGLDVKATEIHGLSQRGGSITSCIKMGRKIYSAVIGKNEADILLSLEALEAARNINYLKKDGLTIFSKRRIPPLKVIIGLEKYPSESDLINLIKKQTKYIYPVDVKEISETIGSRFENVFLMGFLSSFLEKTIDLPCFIDALKSTFSGRILEMNLKAFKKGRGKSLSIGRT